ncbi:nuclear transport factor 2 family protein [Microtetraspora sp. AC03309]|nr:nuclear transport factor 2 family protein [Microtetraspora sp. AC03309]
MTREQRFTAFLTSLPKELAFGDEDPREVIDRYYTPDFVYENDGISLDRDRLVAHVRPARKNAQGLRIEVHEKVLSGNRAAARYTLHATLRKGKVVITQVYLFARFAPDGRLCRIDAITRDLPAA